MIKTDTIYKTKDIRQIAKTIISVIILLLLSVHGFSQDSEKERLKKEKQKLQQEINYTNELLKQAKKSTQTSLNHLVILNKQIEKSLASILCMKPIALIEYLQEIGVFKKIEKCYSFISIPR